MHTWKLETGRLTSTLQPITVTQLSTFPFKKDGQTQCAVIGPGSIKCLHIHQNTTRVLYQVKCELVMTCHVWADSHCLLVGTAGNTLLVVTNGEITQEITDKVSVSRMNTIVILPDGSVLVGMSTGVISVFQKFDVAGQGPPSKNQELARKLKGELDDSKQLKKIRDFVVDESAEITHLSVSDCEQYCIALTSNGAVVRISIDGESIGTDEEILQESLLDTMHSGAILSVSTNGISKPLVVTSGVDHSIRIWNYKTQMQQLVIYFEETPTTVSIHPTSIFIAVTFENSVKILAILEDDLKCVWESLKMSNSRQVPHSV